VSLILDVDPELACCSAKNLGISKFVIFSCGYTMDESIATTTTKSVNGNNIKVILLFFIN